jgi:hypothetical protein
MQDRIAYQGITFDDVLLEPGFNDVVPRAGDVRTQLTRTSAVTVPRPSCADSSKARRASQAECDPPMQPYLERRSSVKFGRNLRVNRT